MIDFFELVAAMAGHPSAYPDTIKKWLALHPANREVFKLAAQEVCSYRLADAMPLIDRIHGAIIFAASMRGESRDQLAQYKSPAPDQPASHEPTFTKPRDEPVDFFEVWHCAKRWNGVGSPLWPAYVSDWGSRSEANKAFLDQAAKDVRGGLPSAADNIARIVTAIKINASPPILGDMITRLTTPEAIEKVPVSPQAVVAHETERVERATRKLWEIAKPGNATWEMIVKELGV